MYRLFLGVGCGCTGALAGWLTIEDVRRLQEPPPTLRRLAADAWGSDTPSRRSYFDTFAAPSATIVRDTAAPGCGGRRCLLDESLRRLDGMALARSFFESPVFRPEKVSEPARPPPLRHTLPERMSTCA